MALLNRTMVAKTTPCSNRWKLSAKPRLKLRQLRKLKERRQSRMLAGKRRRKPNVAVKMKRNSASRRKRPRDSVKRTMRPIKCVLCNSNNSKWLNSSVTSS